MNALRTLLLALHTAKRTLAYPSSGFLYRCQYKGDHFCSTDAHCEIGIKPETVRTAVPDIMEGARDSSGKGAKSKRARDVAAKKKGDMPVLDALLSPDQVEQQIVALEKEMFALAKDLEFEAAAAVRDKIEHLRDYFVRI